MLQVIDNKTCQKPKKKPRFETQILSFIIKGLKNLLS